MKSGTRGEVEGCGLVGLGGDVASADYSVAVGEAEVEEGGFGDGGRLEEGIEAGNCLEHGIAEEGVAKASCGRVFEVGAEGVEGVKIECECLSRILLATIGGKRCK